MSNYIDISINNSPEYKSQIECASCGRFIGIYEICPYCLANNKKRLSIRIFKILSLVFSTFGLILLLFIAQHVKTPIVKIEDITPLSNFAHVRIEGKVEKSFGFHPEWKSVSFTITQPSTKYKNELFSIRVNAYSKVAQKLKELNLIPNEGDEVSVEGTVRFQKDQPTLILNSAKHLSILKKFEKNYELPQEVSIKELSEKHLHSIIKSRAIISKILQFDKGTLIITADNESIPIWIPKSISEKLSITLSVNDVIEFVGVIKYYNNKLEVVINSEKDIVKINTN